MASNSEHDAVLIVERSVRASLKAYGAMDMVSEARVCAAICCCNFTTVARLKTYSGPDSGELNHLSTFVSGRILQPACPVGCLNTDDFKNPQPNTAKNFGI